MDLDFLEKIVVIIGGITAIVSAWQEIIKKMGNGRDKTSVTENRQSSPQLLDAITKLIIAAGIVSLLYGGFIFASANTNITSSKQHCLEGKDANSFQVNQVCDQYANSIYKNDVKPGLIVIGVGLVLIALSTLIRDFTTRSTIGFIIQLLFLALGVWLIMTNR